MVAGMGTGGKSRNSQFTMENQAKTYLGEVDGKVADATVRNKITRHKMNSRAFSLTIARAALEAKTTSDPSPASSMFKYFGTELNKNRFEVMMDIMGTQALGWEGSCFGDRELQATREWLRSKANSIEGGTSEVQLNIIAKRVLLLPD
ncbi:MAG: alkylation response protein AidB-like acyl-CoA dehydrogenase [Candidatus Azotimanducaceae bacterium]|jgi:alkylation response protein AidB-like acyl-CoA dehydrogenase